MYAYAQTNVQLFHQLRSEGYSTKEREYVRDVYEFALRLFTGLFLPSGKPFLDHLVGTASVLASLRLSVDIVAAGLVHAAYLHGNFGGIRKGASEANRREVRTAVGEKVEEYIARYDRMVWHPLTIPVLRDTLDELDAIHRDVLMIHLANELEHCLDLGALYFVAREGWYQRFIADHGPNMMKMAEKLGFPSLSSEMATVFGNVTSAQIPMDPRMSGAQPAAYLIIPRSYRERLSIGSTLKGRWAALKESTRRQLKKYPRIYETLRLLNKTLRLIRSRTRIIRRGSREWFNRISNAATRHAARFYRVLLGHVCFIGVTGSCGKTTTKELVGAILMSRYRGRISKLYNNPDQVAKTLLTVFPWHQFCLHEIGTYEPGVIARSVKIFRPRVGIVTHISDDHCESFGTLEAIAEEKSKLIEALPADGVAVLNADDPRVIAMRNRTKARIITYGFSEEAMVHGEEVSCAWPERLTLTAAYGSQRVRLKTQLLGEHWRYAVLAALATGIALEVPLEHGARVLETVGPVAGRMKPHVTAGGVTFIDDTWKAPLWTFPASLDFMKGARAGRKLVIIGTISDYLETASEIYPAVARKALEIADKAIFLGRTAHRALDAPCNEQDRRLLAFESLPELNYFLNYYLRSGDLVLLKGSDSDHLNRVVPARSREISPAVSPRPS